jgi:alpha-N-arabinofuranosidase
MNRGHHDATSLAVHVLEAPDAREADGRSLQVVSASASTTGSTALLSLSNLDAEASLTIDVDLRGRAVSSATARVLAGDSAAAHNPAEAPDSVAPGALDTELDGGTLRVTLPAHSFATVSLELA